MMGHTLLGGASRRGAFSSGSLHEVAHRDPEPLRQPAQHAQRGIMPAELDPRQIAAAHVGFPGEGFLTQATGCPQPLELLRQGVHARLIVTDLAQAVNRTIAANLGQLWSIHGR